MGFTTFSFFLFVPVVLIGFRVLPDRLRPVWLLTASAVFYASYGFESFLHLVLVVMLAHGAAVGLEAAATQPQRKSVLCLGVGSLIATLCFSKFGDFALAEFARLTDTSPVQTGLTPPPGFSFYIFMAVAYVVDVWRGLVRPAALAQTALQLSWFPKLLAGPIERAGSILPQLGDNMRAKPVQTMLALQLILWGLVKKVVVAENLAPVVDQAFAIPAYAPPMELLISLYFFAFQLYCDFSGYTDMAIGLSLLFGIVLHENFRRPFLSLTVNEFWSRRWHISLGNWFRDYLFFPLTGSAGSSPRRQHLALWAVFAASGLWHAGLGYGIGWAFLVWGLLNGAYVSVEKLLQPAARRFAKRHPQAAGSATLTVLRIFVTFHLILITWTFFRAATVGDALTILRRIALALPEMVALITRYPFTGDHLLGAGLIVGLLAVEVLSERQPFAERLRDWPTATRWAVWYGGLAALLLFGRWGDAGFIYQGF
ncbi:MAG: MBOAT family protein [Alphaproteobacteria bacterium HGW-Alphaproteobacteria-6]|nr:MAG: MBOAT family protein [Alphaproteobacteria bacterium HGW-Alphaproteobacteria-6]